MTWSWLRRLGAIGVWFALVPAIAQAHPLGNFTINHLAQIRAHRGAMTLTYTLDIAEIPTFQIQHARPGAWDAARLRQWANDETAVVIAGLDVAVDGAAVPLVTGDPRASLRPGAGGLPTLYWTATFPVPLDARSRHHVEIADRVYADRRIGWKDVVVPPLTDPTQALTHYPSALIGSPRRNNAADFAVTPAGDVVGARVRSEDDANVPTAGITVVRSGYLSDLFARPGQSPWTIAFTVLVAFGLGALHGLEPGHGKALLAFTLVGARATVKQAAVLAASLTLAHTIAVLLLGLALFFLADFASESIFGWIALFSGAAIAFIGARSLNEAVAHARPHGDGGHSHAIGGNRPLRFSNAVVAAMSGGIAPCPAAIVVLLAALRLHRVGYGLVLIVIFSLGLAAVLTAIGIAVVHGAAWVARRGSFDRIMRYAPLGTAAVISVAGSIMVAQGFAQQGVAVPAPLIVALTLAAIGGYALVPRHSHAAAEGARST